MVTMHVFVAFNPGVNVFVCSVVQTLFIAIVTLRIGITLYVTLIVTVILVLFVI